MQIRVAHYAERCNTLGPGRRGVLWVQGCSFRCPGCVSPETRSFTGGTLVDASELANLFCRVEDIEGLTFSGGEPTLQAAALNELIDRVRAVRPDFNFMSYTGAVYEELASRADADVRGFLARLDILIDGPYIAELHADLLWRGSSNQRALFLSDRCKGSAIAVDSPGVGLEMQIKRDRSCFWMGVPREKDFRAKLRRALNAQGVALPNEEYDDE